MGGVNSKKEVEKDEQPLKESRLELTQEDEKSDLVIEAAVIQDICTEETASKEFDGNMDEEGERNVEPAEQTAPLTENLTEPENLQNLMKIENEDETKDINSGIETFEIVTNDMIDDMEKSGASSLEAKCDSRTDDLSSEGGTTTDEGIEGSDDDEKEEEDEKPKKQMCETIEPILVPLSQ